MTGAAALARAIVVTWPPAAEETIGPFRVPHGDGGGNRVSAARLADPACNGADVSDGTITAVEAAQARAGQTPLFMVFDWQEELDRRLAQAGLGVRDATDMLLGPVAGIAAPPPPVSCFEIWPPLAVVDEIWAAGGIGPDRLAVMQRAKGPKTSFLGRMNDRPAGAAFVALDPPYAMLHALEVRPDARRQGLARIMVRAAARWAQAQGADHLAVLVTRENVAAQSLYARLGLRRTGGYHYRARPKSNA